MKARTLSIAGRAVSSMIKSQGVGDLYELYVFAKRNGIDYNLAYIPADFLDTSTQAFDPVYMTKLYDLGYQMARTAIRGRRPRPAWGTDPGQGNSQCAASHEGAAKPRGPGL